MSSFLNKTSNIDKYFSLLLAIMPISFIAGNLIINLNVILIIVSALIFFKKDLFNIKFFILDKFIFAFFFLIIFTGIYNDIYFIATDAYPAGFNTIKKSFLFLRYLLLYIALRYLIEKKLINLKYFFISCLACSLFVSLDIFYQFKFGKDIFGFEIVNNERRLSGPFGDELIAGGYLTRFSIFSLFLVPLFYTKSSQQIIKFLTLVLIIIFILGIILSGNRMPLIMFIFTLSLITIFQKQTRKYLFVFVASLVVIFSLTFKLNPEIKTHFFNFYDQVNKIVVYVSKGELKKGTMQFNTSINPNTGYLKEFETFYNTWLMNKYIGGGIKNFRWYCHHREPGIHKRKGFICNMHPHNYYLEILTEVGLLGMIIVMFIFLRIIYLSFYKKYFSKSSLKYDNIIIPFIFLFISEIFPLKSTGSFFTTNNTTYLFLIVAILIGLINRDNFIENKN